MSTGIGDYIHYYRKNYIKYGINRNTPDSSIGSFSKAYFNAKNSLKQLYSTQAKKANWKRYEDFLNEAIYNNFGKFSNKIDKKLYKDMIEKFFKESFPDMKGNIDSILLAATSKEYSTGGFKLNKSIQKNNKKGTYQIRITKSTIEKEVKKLDFLLKKGFSSIKKDNTINQDELKDMIDGAERIKDKFEKILIQMEKDSVNRIKINKGDKFTQNTTDAGKALEALNDIYKFYNSYLLTSLFTGASLETVVGSASAAGAFVGGRALNDIANPIVGGDKFKNAFTGFGDCVDMNKLTGIINQNIKNNENKWQNNGDMIISGNESQGTVDISINLEDGSVLKNELGINSFNASLKNYKNIDKHGVSIVSGVSLLTIFMLLESDFVNHYLNLISSRTPKGYQRSEPLQKIADSVIKYGVAVRGLFGARGSAISVPTADCFVVNNRSATRVKVFGVGELLDQIAINPDLVKVKLPTKITQEREGTTNSWDAATTRITKLLAQTHSIKLYASLLPNALGSWE